MVGHDTPKIHVDEDDYLVNYDGPYTSIDQIIDAFEDAGFDISIVKREEEEE